MGNPFAAYHPSVGFAYLVVAIVFSMAAFHPVYVACSLAGALCCSLLVRGARATAKTALFALPLVACIALANMLFSSTGATELFAIGSRAFYLEAACFGACMGCLFAAMMLWFACYAAIMDSEATASLMGAALPTVSLMVSQVVGLVPQFLRRGKAIGAVQEACSAARAAGRSDALRQRLRTVNVLMSWGMEDCLVRADCMRARGYGCLPSRTRFRKQRFAWRDGAMLAGLAALSVVNAALAAAACSQFEFYPSMSNLVPWWGYAPYLLFMGIPLALALRERVSWNR